ncbi:E3 ubiquitin-protein ligase RBBP6 [Collichthys lucidus]|uniref:E3 ubiquitin-protein ligase RBBP6 n=1 Tax=Collichthys lucidus TaxID=240159 RepID=A0A4V6ATC7_COLLU|nr:E3 ubiquitin-protein ligase RBBP6 [Collichthys lucidus]
MRVKRGEKKVNEETGGCDRFEVFEGDKDVEAWRGLCLHRGNDAFAVIARELWRAERHVNAASDADEPLVAETAEYTEDDGLIPKGSSVIVRRIPLIGARSNSNKTRNIERSDVQHHSFGAAKAVRNQTHCTSSPAAPLNTHTETSVVFFDRYKQMRPQSESLKASISSIAVYVPVAKRKFKWMTRILQEPYPFSQRYTHLDTYSVCQIGPGSCESLILIFKPAISGCVAHIHSCTYMQMANLADADVSEEDKLKVILNQNTYESVNYKKFGGVLPANYTCYRCGNTGHHIRNCPTSGKHTHRVIAEVNAEREEGKAELKRKKVNDFRVINLPVICLSEIGNRKLLLPKKLKHLNRGRRALVSVYLRILTSTGLCLGMEKPKSMRLIVEYSCVQTVIPSTLNTTKTIFREEIFWKVVPLHWPADLDVRAKNGSCVLSGNIPIEGRTVDGRERETESVTRKEVKKIQVWSKDDSSSRAAANSRGPHESSSQMEAGGKRNKLYAMYRAAAKNMLIHGRIELR